MKDPEPKIFSAVREMFSPPEWRKQGKVPCDVGRGAYPCADPAVAAFLNAFDATVIHRACPNHLKEYSNPKLWSRMSLEDALVYEVMES